MEDDKELIRRQERSLEDKKEALIHKKTETENQEHTSSAHQNELEIRKNILNIWTWRNAIFWILTGYWRILHESS